MFIVQEPSSTLCLTFGNESCDLDSIVSALVYAHFKTREFSNESSATVSLPLLQCHKEDLALNQEATFLFNMLGIDGSDLLCLDDISPDVLSSIDQVSLVLVDHNTPTGTLIRLLYQAADVPWVV